MPLKSFAEEKTLTISQGIAIQESQLRGWQRVKTRC